MILQFLKKELFPLPKEEKPSYVISELVYFQLLEKVDLF